MDVKKKEVFICDRSMKVQSLADETFLRHPEKLRSENCSGMIIFEKAGKKAVDRSIIH